MIYSFHSSGSFSFFQIEIISYDIHGLNYLTGKDETSVVQLYFNNISESQKLQKIKEYRKKGNSK